MSKKIKRTVPFKIISLLKVVSRHLVAFIVYLGGLLLAGLVILRGLLPIFIPSATLVYEPRIAYAQAPKLILFFDGATIPTGWTCISDNPGEPFYERFPRGEATYGGTGGVSTHTHTASYVSCSGPSATAQYDDSGGAANYPSTTHTHPFSSVSVDTATNIPSYRALKVIRCDAGVPSTIPAGAIALFDTTSLPANWTAYSVQNNYFVMGGPNVTTGGSNTHTHNVTASGSASADPTDLAKAASANGEATNHTHTGTTPTDSQDHRPPYLEVVLASATVDTSLPDGLIGMFDDTSPSGWTVKSGSGGDFYQRFIVGNTAAYGATGDYSSHNHGNLGVTLAATANTITTGDAAPPEVGADVGHTHTMTFSFTSVSNLLAPYTNVIVAKYSAAAEAPGAPTDLKFIEISTSTKLDWSASTTTTATYNVFRSTSSPGTEPWTVLITGLANSTTQYNDNDGSAAGNTLHTYRVAAIASGLTTYCTNPTEVSTTTWTQPPENPTYGSSVYQSSVTINWSAPTSGGASYYYIQNSAVSESGPWNDRGSTGGTSFTDTGLSAGADYWHRIQGVNKLSVPGLYSAVITTTTKTGPTPAISLDTFADKTPTVTAGDTDKHFATVKVTGSNGGGTIDQTTCTINGSVTAGQVTNVKVYYNTSDSLTGATVFGQNNNGGSGWGSGSVVRVTGSLSTGDGTYYLLYCLSVSGDSGGQTVGMTCNTVGANVTVNNNIPLPQNTGEPTIQTVTVVKSSITACSDCHGMPPLDGADRRAFTSSATVVGDHQTDKSAEYTGRANVHASVSTTTCIICHPSTVGDYGFDHRNGNIDMNSNIKGGSYNKGTSFAQSSTPVTGYCQNTSCHGTSSLAQSQWGIVQAKCNSCHQNFEAGAQAAAFTNNPRHQKHASQANVYKFACEICHSRNNPVGYRVTHVTGTVSANQAGEVQFARDVTVWTSTGYGDSSEQFRYIRMNYNSYLAAAVSPGYNPDVSAAGADNGLNWTDGTCSNIWCHSNASPSGGNNSYASVSWNDTAFIDCLPCHSNTGDGGTNLSAKHSVHVTSYSYTCDECHVGTMLDDSKTSLLSGTTLHVNTEKNWKFSNFAFSDDSIDNSGGSYAGGGGACSNLYCHSNGQNTSPPFSGTSPNWGGDTTCTSCHRHNIASGQAMVSGSHYKHILTTGSVGIYYRCNVCHDGIVTADDANITGFTQHVNAAKNVVFRSTPNPDPEAYQTRGTGKCSLLYCHSNGVKTTAIDYSTPTWNVDVATCGFCHGRGDQPGKDTSFNPVWGEPNYNNAGLGQAKSNSHRKHVDAASDCRNCHSKTVDTNGYLIDGSTRHISQVRDVSSGTYYFSYSVSGDSKTCSSIGVAGQTCHGGSTAKWGQTLSCIDCHGKDGDDVDDYAYGTTPMAMISTNSTYGWYGSSHYVVAAASCTNANCHNPNSNHNDLNNPFRLYWPTYTATGANAEFGCKNCHTTAVRHSSTTTGGNSWGLPSAQNPAQDFKCIDCHDPHKDRNFFRSTLAVSKLVQARVACNSSSSRGVPDFGGLSTAPVNFTLSLPPKATDYVITGGTNTRICQTCHQANDYYTINWGSTTDHNGGATDAACTGCHTHSNGFAASCVICHGAPPNPAAHRKHYNGAASTPTSYDLTDNLSSGTIYVYGCKKCHSGTHQPNLAKSSTFTVEIVFDATVFPKNSGATYTRLGAGTTHYYKSPEVPDSGYQFLYYNGGQCGNAYCHGYLKTGANNTIGISSKPAWGEPTWTGDKCSNCHSISTTTASGATHRVHISSYSYRWSCEACHYDTAGSTYTVKKTSWHVDGYLNWNLANETISDYIPASAKYRGYNSSSTASLGGYAGYCTNLYCHSNGQTGSGLAYSSATWGATLECNGCHDSLGANTLLTAGHQMHTSTSTDNNKRKYGYQCEKCHNLTVQGNSTIIGFSTHVSVSRNVSMSTGSYVSATRRCNNTYCHSSGTTTWAGGTPTSTVTWTSTGAVNCDSCHRGPDLGGPNYYLSGGGKPNAHTKHTSYKCNQCHWQVLGTSTYTVTYATNHVNNIYNVNPSTSYTFSYSSKTTPTASSCSGIGVAGQSCHGGGFAVWSDTTPLKCSSCHFAASDKDDYNWLNSTMAMVNSTEWLVTGHGRSSSTFHESGNRGASLPQPGGAKTDSADPCLFCHSSSTAHGVSGNPFRLYVSTDNSVCDRCHLSNSAGVDPDGSGTDYININGSTKVAGPHITKIHGTEDSNLRTDGGVFCWDCHDPHGDYDFAGSTLAFMIQVKTIELTEGTTQAESARGVPYTIIADTVTFRKAKGGDLAAYDWQDYVDITTPLTDGLCQECHKYSDMTKKWWTQISSEATHATDKCTKCHSHDNNFKGAGCSGCHGGSLTEYQNKNFWPDGIGTGAYPDRVGKHNTHVIAISSRNVYDLSVDTGQRSVCVFCHKATVDGSMPTTHNSNGQTDLRNDNEFKYINASTDTQSSGSTSTHKCDNMDCHNQIQTPAWDVGASTSCTICHPASGQFTYAHVKHTTPTYTYGSVVYSYNYKCTECHDDNTQKYSAKLSSYSHQDGFVNMNFTIGSTQTIKTGSYDKLREFDAQTSSTGFKPSWNVYSSTFGPCYNIYCHRPSSWTAINWNQTWEDKTWGGFNRCDKCHGLPPLFSDTIRSSYTHYGDHTTGATGTVNASTQVFALGQSAGEIGGYNFGCKKCHPDPTSDASKHAKGMAVPSSSQTANITFDGGTDPKNQYAAYSAGVKASSDTRGYWYTTGRCSTTFCHGATLPSGMRQGVSTPTWKTDLSPAGDSACGACHDISNATSGSHKKHVSISVSSYAYKCDLCHFDTAASTYTVRYSSHHVDGRVGWNFNKTDVRLSSPTASYKGASFGSTGTIANYGPTIAVSSCTNLYCHTKGQRKQAGFGAPRVEPRWGGNPLDCNGCHSSTNTYTLMSSSHPIHVSTNTLSAGRQYAFTCETCHKDTVAGNMTIKSFTLHVSSVANVVISTYSSWNRTSPAGGNATYERTTGKCTKTYCHSDGTAKKTGSLTQWATPQWIAP